MSQENEEIKNKENDVGETLKNPNQIMKAPKSEAEINELILKKLEALEDNQEKLADKINNAPEVVVNTNPNSGFDITKLSLEERQALKEMLSATPDSINRKNKVATLSIRKIYDKYVVAFGKAYLNLVDDQVLQKKVERHYIPVLFFGEDKMIPVDYRDFQLSERVNCEIIDKVVKLEPKIEGEVMSRETGTLVNLVRQEVKTFFKIKLPTGEIIEALDGEFANA